MGTFQGGIGRSTAQYEDYAMAAHHDAGAATGALGPGGPYWRQKNYEEEEEGGSKESDDLSYLSKVIRRMYSPQTP